MTYIPGQGLCYRCVFITPPLADAVPTCKEAGVLGVMGGIIGTIQAAEAIKYLLNLGESLTGSLQCDSVRFGISGFGKTRPTAR